MARKNGDKKARPVGRPTLYTPEIGEAICFALAEGGTLKQICAADDMPARATVNRWLVSQDESFRPFQEAHRIARAAGAFVHADEIIEISAAEKARWQQAVQPVYDAWIGEMNRRGRNGRAMFNDLLAITGQPPRA